MDGVPLGYAPLAADTLAGRLGDVPAIRDRLGDPARWSAREVGDGNLNLVFVLSGPRGRVIGKQDSDDKLPPAPVNRTFETLFALERHAIGRLPFTPGVSIAAVLRA